MATTPSQSPPSTPGDPAAAAVIAPALLADLTNPALSLNDVASRNNLSPSQLSVDISRAAVSNHLAALHVLAIERARLLASFHLSQAVHGLSEVLKRGVADHEPAPSPAAASAETDAPKPAAILLRAAAIRARRLETLRRAATTVLQITRLNPPVFNYSSTHAQLEIKPPIQTVPTPASNPAQPPRPPASAAPAPVQLPLPQLAKADLQALLSPVLDRTRSRHARHRDLESMLATAGSIRPHEHWP